MSPDVQGWVKCVKCGCWRLPSRDGKDEVRPVPTSAQGEKAYTCADEVLCKRLAKRTPGG